MDNVREEMRREKPEMSRVFEEELQRRLAALTDDLAVTMERVYRPQITFQRHLYQQWQAALDYFALLLDLCRHDGMEYYQHHWEQANQEHDFTFAALSAVQARGCLAAGGVLALLREGYAQEAYTRWRTVLELAVIAVVLRKSGQDVAERYLDHADIESEKLAREMQTASEAAGDPVYSKAEMIEVTERRAALVTKYGKPFTSQFGWAATVMGNPQPRFEDLLRFAGFDQFRPYYRIASFFVHPTYRGTSYNIALPPNVRVQMYGPSTYGLSAAGEGAAQLLFMITIMFLNTRKGFDTLVRMHVLRELCDTARVAFQETHTRLAAMHAAADMPHSPLPPK